MSDVGPARTAVVTDWLTVRGGAARTVEAVLDARPGAPVHTLVYEPRQFEGSPIARHEVHTSFLQRLPGARGGYRTMLPLMPLAIERLDMREYDLVISLSHAVAKGVLTSADQLHVSYIFTPVRYGWDLQRGYLDDSGFARNGLTWLVHPLLHYLRLWDLASSRRPDAIVAASHYVARRIRKVYGRDAKVIHPPVDIDRFVPHRDRDDYYLTVSRLVAYKKIDLLAQAFTKLDRPLVIVGDGPERSRIARCAGSNVKLLGWRPDHEVGLLLERCRAFVFAADEDFGIAPVEALAAGAPVIAYGRGGVIETVTPGETGVFFDRQDPDAIIGAVREFEAARGRFDPEQMRCAAEPFARPRFQRRFEALIDREWRRLVRRRTWHCAAPASPLSA